MNTQGKVTIACSCGTKNAVHFESESYDMYEITDDTLGHCTKCGKELPDVASEIFQEISELQAMCAEHLYDSMR